MSWHYMNYRPYVSVGVRLRKASRQAAQIARKEKRAPQPVSTTGRKITATFWGNAWCQNLASYSDYANRLDRGVRDLRNGSVVDLVITSGTVRALVAGSETYTVQIDIDPLAKSVWSKIKKDCSKSIDSLLDLLSGKLSQGVMGRLTKQKEGLFPSPKEIHMTCSCPDWSDCCKHLAAVMYGIGVRLDDDPELLFRLRDVDQKELASHAVSGGNLDRALATGRGDGSLADADLSSIFGIEIDDGESQAGSVDGVRRKRRAQGTRSAKRVRPSAAAAPRKSAKRSAKSAKSAKSATRPSPKKAAKKSAKKKTAKKKGKRKAR